MSLSLWLGLLAAALGTYLIRLLPLWWMQRRLKRRDPQSRVDAMPEWLAVLGPMMIAAVLGVSLVPKTADASGWLATLFGLVATWLVWRRTRSLGLPVAAGVAIFGVAIVMIGALFPPG
ncbi:AzlD domain-containing protein [Salinicola avicenniae]|uniref:AzlD domain-containing protein n=1 Tax=Salinicola avicenniae TaxID=2916836 RepID=UPI002072E886|nr:MULTISPECIES: AzlD domain-containing protein [unclassified Salinicola]